ncbi:MAG: SpoIIE family protein phosphatase [Phycisphaerales bacterium]
MTDPFVKAPPMTLRSVDPSVSEDVRLDGDAFAVVLGRHERCDVRLDVAAVSRQHAEVRSVGGRWHVVDLDSRHGTYLNNARVERRPVPLEHGDRLEIGPVAFRVVSSVAEPETRRASTIITTIEGADGAEQAPSASMPVSSTISVAPANLRDILRTLRDADDAQSLYDEAAEIIVDQLRGGRCLFVRPSSGFEEIELIAGSPSAVAYRPLSRSLLRDASERGFVCLQSGSAANEAHSIISSGVKDAWCTPLEVDEHHASYLYYDTDKAIGIHEDEVAVVIETVRSVVEFGLSRFARHEVEARFEEMERELDAARAVQLRLMPMPEGSVGGRRYRLRCEAGYYVAGDIFGVGERPDGRAYAYLGDVTGHGVAPSLIMSATKSHLDALLATDLPLRDTVSRLNAYITSVTSTMEFVTLAVLEFDDDAGTVTVVDAGHGYILVQSDSGTLSRLDARGGIPIGIEPKYSYESTTLPLDGVDRIVLMSDGVPEQINEVREQFGLVAAIDSIRADKSLAALFKSLHAHAGDSGFNDDVTVATIESRPSA